MFRTVRNLGLVTALLLLPMSASALGISITNVASTGGNTNVLQVGDVITFDLVLENSTATEIFALGVGVDGYDSDLNGLADNGLVLAGSNVAARAFNIVPGFGGINNIRYDATGGTGVDGGVELGFNNPFNALFGLPTIEPLRVSIFDGISLDPITGDGSNDIGINGGLVDAAGLVDVHLQISFQATAGANVPAVHTLRFGDESQGFGVIGDGGAILDFTDASYSFSVVPEPGTALLMGLGLAGLAGIRRR